MAVAIKMVDLEKYEGKTDLVRVAFDLGEPLQRLVHAAYP
jgi:hypothetical protein